MGQECCAASENSPEIVVNDEETETGKRDLKKEINEAAE
jgi:hypothetical protein